MRKIYILPNLFTAASLFSGVMAIFAVYDGDPAAACWLIVLAAVLDVFDGAVARLTHTTSDFGLNFDSLSDLVAFGVAPAVLAYESFGGFFPRLTIAVCGLYVVCGALRLARFNVQAGKEEKKMFLGLPIPAAALATISMVWVFDINPLTAGMLPIERLYPPAMVIVAYLMVSKVGYLGFKSLHITRRAPFETLFTLVVIAFLIYLLHRYFDIVLFITIWSYVLVGLAMRLLPGAARRSAVAHAAAQAPPAAEEPRT